MSLRRTYAAYEQEDSAVITVNGLFYYCSVWLNRADRRIESLCYIKQENGEVITVFENSVRAQEDVEVDCPKIIAHGNVFVVHWLESPEGETLNFSLHRATMDMENFSVTAWTYRSSVALHVHALYDVCPDEGASTDYVVIRKVLTDRITIQRFDGPLWADTVWTTNYDGTHVFPSAMCVHCHTGDDKVSIVFEGTDAALTAYGGLAPAIFDASSGVFIGSATSLDDEAGIGDGHYPQIGLARTNTNTLVCVVERAGAAEAALGAPYTYFHSVWAAEMDISAGGQAMRWGAETLHLNLLSRPWAYVGGRNLSNARNEVYCVVGYKSVTDPQNWQQAYAYCVNLDYLLFASEGGIPPRARPVSNLTTPGIPNTAPSGYSPMVSVDLFGGGAPSRRMCHIASACEGPPFGPEVKTRSTAGNVFQRASAQSSSYQIGQVNPETVVVSELLPTNAAIVEYVHHHEDPHVMYRDVSDPIQPDTNFRHPYARAMHQHAKAGSGLFISGGTPQMYDGRQMVECGFPWNPEILGYTESYVEGELEPGEHQYYVVARWRDGAVVHRSGPSNIFTIRAELAEDQTPENLNLTASIQVRTQCASLKDSLAHFQTVQPIEFEIFRTTVDGLVFYRVFGSGDANSEFNQEDVPINRNDDYVITFNDGVSDVEIVAQGLGPYQYQDDANGGPAAGFSTLVPVVVPAFTCVAEWQNRIVGISAQDGLFWPSSEMTPELGGELLMAPEFNPARTYRANIGEVTAIKAMAETLYVWTRDTVYALTGTPQSDSAIADATLQLIVIQEGIGCVNPSSLVLTPRGIFFQSQKGYYLLDRGRNVVPAGADARRYMQRAGNIRNATDFENRHQIRLTCDDAPIRTYVTILTPTIVGNAEGTWSFTPTGFPASSFVAGAATNLAALLIGMLNAVSANITDEDYEDVIASVVIVGSTLRITWAPDVFPDFALAFPVGDNLTGASSSTVEIRPLVLIYDYLRDVWTSRPLLALSFGDSVRAASTASACAWEGSNGELLHVVLQQSGLMIERETTDDDAFMDSHPSEIPFGIPIRLRTSWIHVAGFAGAQRIRSAGVQTAKPNSSQYHVDMGFTFDGDYDNPTIEEDLTITVSPPHMRVRPRYQKCVAFYIEVYEENALATENVRILGLSAELGIEGGTFRPPAAQVTT
jgi:hypothetical protein